jgi:hypothetical protein
MKMKMLPPYFGELESNDENHKRLGEAMMSFLNYKPRRLFLLCYGDKNYYKKWIESNDLEDSAVQRSLWAIDEYFRLETPIYKELALYLGISEQAVKQSNPKKRYLMLLGLAYHKNIENMKDCIGDL